MAGRIVVLILLIIGLSIGGIVWFDYLNLVDVKTVFSPVYRLFGRDGRTQPKIPADENINIDAERLYIRLTALDTQKMELDTRQRDLDLHYGELMQMAQELEEWKRALEEQKESLRVQEEDAENKDSNVERSARNFIGMLPERAVAIMAAMDDQEVIDILRKTEEIAKANNTMSIVPYWLSLMEPKRAGDLVRKMSGRP